MIPKLVLKPDREKSVLHHHPWIFSGAIAEVKGFPSPGSTVGVYDSGGKFLCWAAFSPASKISGRIWSWEESETIDENYFRRRIKEAVLVRKGMEKYSNALRLVYAESDGIPGVIVDRYADLLVIQFLSAGAEYWKDCIVNVCSELTKINNIYERSDVEVRNLEGLTERTGILMGSLSADNIIITEYGRKYLVDVFKGHKTGFYLDQRDNRNKVGVLAADRDVLDCFSYTGGFSVSALRGGARSLTAIETSTDAIGLANANMKLNMISHENVEHIEGDVFNVLRALRDRNLSYDLIILDPPKFAPTQASIKHAIRGYKDINLLAFKLLRRNGILVTYSCSGAIDELLFQKIVAGAALDVGTEAQIIDRMHQASDHPIRLNFPEGAYLKGLVIYKVR